MVEVDLSSLGLLPHGQLSLAMFWLPGLPILLRIDPSHFPLSQLVNPPTPQHLACVIPVQVGHVDSQLRTAETLMPLFYTWHRLLHNLGRRRAPESRLMGSLCRFILRRTSQFGEGDSTYIQPTQCCASAGGHLQ